MFTDLVGFSALAQQNEALALELVDTKRQLLNPLLDQHKGTLIKTMGDGFLIEFSSALQAVQCAIGIQAMLQGYNSSQVDERKINLRIGIHLGDVEFKDGDVFGDGVNIASRIEPLAEPGGICISEDVARQVQNKAYVDLESIGTPELKNIDESFEVFKLKLSVATSSSSEAPDLSKSIAVLPFDNMSTEPDNEFFSDGLTEDILTKLSKVRDLKVISRTSVMQYKDTKKNLREIGNELGVGVVVEGSVRRAGDQIRVTAQLIDAATDEHLWADSYDRKLENIFDVQSDVAEKIVEALQASISEEEHQQLHQVQTENSEAYQLYLKGLQLWHSRSVENLIESAKIFEQAIELDPNYALAYVGLANTLILPQFTGTLPKSEYYVKASECAEKALEIDPNLGEAYASMALIEVSANWDAKKAIQYFKKAIELNPNDVTAYHWYGVTLDLLGQIEESEIQYKKAIELSPLYAQVRMNYVYALLKSGKVDQAEDELLAIGKMDGSKEIWIRVCSIFYMATGRYREGLAVIHDAYETKLIESGTIIASEAAFYLGIGERERAYELFIEYLVNPGTKDILDTFMRAEFLLMMGKKQTVLDILWKAYDERDISVLWLLRAITFDPIRDEPRFQELLEKIGWGMD
jgi:TolB-like protein